MPDYAEHDSEVAKGILALIELTSATIDRPDLQEILEFVEAHEFSLALESLSAAVLASRARLNEEVVVGIKNLAVKMQITDDAAINGIIDGYERQSYRIAM